VKNNNFIEKKTPVPDKVPDKNDKLDAKKTPAVGVEENKQGFGLGKATKDAKPLIDSRNISMLKEEVADEDKEEIPKIDPTKKAVED